MHALRADDRQRAQAAFDRVESDVRAELAAAYSATHRAVDVLRRIEPAASVATR